MTYYITVRHFHKLTLKTLSQVNHKNIIFSTKTVDKVIIYVIIGIVYLINRAEVRLIGYICGCSLMVEP